MLAPEASELTMPVSTKPREKLSGLRSPGEDDGHDFVAFFVTLGNLVGRAVERVSTVLRDEVKVRAVAAVKVGHLIERKVHTRCRPEIVGRGGRGGSYRLWRGRERPSDLPR